MGVKAFGILLDSPIYYSGRKISGKLVVVVDKSTKMRGIRIKYSGKAKVRWEEGMGDDATLYSSKEKYLDLQQSLYGDYSGESKLAAGRHVFDFSCELPTNCPSSFEGEHGRIKYSVKATIDIPWKRDPVAKTMFTVASVFDLNNLPVAAAPVSDQHNKTFWPESNLMSIAVGLPVRGYVPGQTMNIAVRLNNQTNVSVYRISANLHQNVTFRASKRSKHSKELIARHAVNDVSASGRYYFRITIPPLPPSYLEHCTIMDLRYHLTVTAEVGPLRRDLKCCTEILIGNVPLMNYQRPAIIDHNVLPTTLVERGCSSGSRSLDRQPPPYNAVFPPSKAGGYFSPSSYEESTISLSRKRKEKFAPLYPVYKFDTHHH